MREQLHHLNEAGGGDCARHRGFTLLEMLVTLTIIAALTAVVAPMFSDDSRMRVMAASSIIASDIELAQVMSIAKPDQPVVVRFNPAQGRYWLAYAGTPNSPLLREDNGLPYEVVMGSGRARSASGVTLNIQQATDNSFTFAAHGGLSNFTQTPVIKVMAGSRGIMLTISPTTGSVREAEFTPTPADQPTGEAEAIDIE